MFFVYKKSHEAKKSVGCKLNLDTYVRNGTVIYEVGSQRAKIQCEDGYKLIGSPVVECLSSGHWNETPTCLPKECKNLPVPANAHVKLNNLPSSILRYVNVSCNEGYLLGGNQTVVCLNNETWSPVPVCRPVDCGDPPHIDNGHVEDVSSTTYKNAFHIECNDGYYLEDGTETIVCQANGKWNEIPECAPVSCGPPEIPYGAYIISQDGIVFQKSVKFTCKAGYRMKGYPTVICQRNGKWTKYPKCEYSSDPCNSNGSGFAGIFLETMSKKFSLLFLSLLIIQILINF